MKKSDGYPNRILREGTAGGREIKVTRERDRNWKDGLVAICAVAGLMLGLANWCHHSGTKNKLADLEEKIIKDADSDKYSEVRELKKPKKIKKEKRLEAGSGANALPPEEPGIVDLGSKIKMVLPRK